MDNKKRITCNMCGNTWESKNEIIEKDFLCICKDWGYFSEKDGQHHQLILCETCYDQWSKSLKIPPQITDTIEMI